MKLLAELLTLEAEKDAPPGGILDGVEKLANTAKKGYENAKKKFDDKATELKDAEKKAQETKKAAEKKAKDAERQKEQAKKYAEKEAQKAGKAAEAEHKLKSAESMASLKDDLSDFVESLFANFPDSTDARVQEIMDKYPTLEAAREAYNSFKGFGERFEELRQGFNKSLVEKEKVKRAVVENHIKNAKAVVKDGKFSNELQQFVRSESKFFKRLVQVTDDFKLDDNEFKELLTLKINQTDAFRVSDAAKFLNIIFLYATARFEAHARVIAAVGRNLQDAQHAADREARDRARAAKAAATPDPTD